MIGRHFSNICRLNVISDDSISISQLSARAANTSPHRKETCLLRTIRSTTRKRLMHQRVSTPAFFEPCHWVVDVPAIEAVVELASVGTTGGAPMMTVRVAVVEVRPDWSVATLPKLVSIDLDL
jgi:hypothetical protein